MHVATKSSASIVLVQIVIVPRMPYAFALMDNFAAKQESVTDSPLAAEGAARRLSGWRVRMAAGPAVLAILFLTGWQVWGSYGQALTDMEILSGALARGAEDHVAGVLGGVDLVLAEMVEQVSADGTVDGTAFNSRLSNRMAQVTAIRNALILDTKGRVLASTLPVALGADLSDREYFTVPSQNSSLRFYISPPLTSRFLNVSTFAVSRPIRGTAGEFLGVAVVGMDSHLLEDPLSVAVPATGGRAALIRDDGIVLARMPASAEWQGVSVAGGGVFQALATGQLVGVLHGRGKIAGDDRVAAYRRFNSYPLIVVVALSTQSALAPWRSSALSHGAVALALALALLGFATMSDRRQAERFRAQQALALSEARYRRLAERSPVGIVQADPLGICVYANDRWVEITGRRREDLLGRKWCDSVMARDRPSIAAAWDRAVQGGCEMSEEMRIKTPEGKVRWVRLRASSLGEVEGMAGQLVLIFEDITAAREASRALILSEEKFAKAFLGSPDALVISTMEGGSYVEVNDAFCQLLGYSRAEFMGSDARTLNVWADPKDREKAIALVLKDGQVENYEAVLRRNDASTLVVQISLQQIMVAGEDCLLFICRDISERREIEARTQTLLARLDASNKELEQFAYVTSHDLQEPLRMIAGYARLLERRYHGRLDSDADDFIGFLVDGAKRMQGMILDLLDYSRVDRLGGDFVLFDGEAALEDVGKNLSAALAEAQGRLTIGAIPTVTADRSQFVRLFQNLIGNALKYRHPDRVPEISVTAACQDDSWLFSVTDNGIGIEPQYFDRIFLVFQRLHTREHYQGSGIGLAICKKIVERHGGRIWLDSQEGVGSSFHFTLPIHPTGQDGLATGL